MKYNLYMAASFLSKEDAKIYGRYGFTFKELDYSVTEDSRMYRTNEKSTIELHSLEDLNNFIKEVGQVIIDGNSITIYNGYVE